MNYLVALLSSIYDSMQLEGEHKQLQMRYTFYTKYLRLFAEGIHYENDNIHHIDNLKADSAMHPPPLNLIALLFDLITGPFLWKKDITKKYKFSIFLSISMFWCENIFFIALFFCFHLAIIPVVYCKVFFSFVMKINKKKKVIGFVIIWLFFGFFILIGIAFYDTYNFFRIFCRL